MTKADRLTPTAVEQIMSTAAFLTCRTPVTESHVVVAGSLRRTSTRQPPCGVPDADGLATLSHELKTPLVALLGFVHLLESDAQQPLSEPQRERAQRTPR